jgi:hypothetical protein
MFEHSIVAMIEIQRKVVDIATDAALLLQDGKSVLVTVEEDTEEKREARRTMAQNRLIYLLYQRIGKTLYGGDESHARNECKLRTGCRILYRDSKKFAKTFDEVIRPLQHELRLSAMNLISVSSIMKPKQCTEYIKTIMTEYGQQGVYFLDLEGAQEYVNYPEASK